MASTQAKNTASTRPTVSVYSVEGKKATKTGSVPLPAVFNAPIRPDVVHFVHTNLAKNRRQPYAVNKFAGTDTSAASYGTGRAVARIPRVGGGGTHRAGQGAFGNMCRGGRLFAPTKIWRRWHRKVNLGMRRVATASAIAATGLPSLVMARGHLVDKAYELPVVVKDDIQSIKKTKEAIAALDKLHILPDVRKVKRSRRLRAGKGKMRNRRYVQKRGPLVIYKEDHGIRQAFRNVPGVDTINVRRLGLLALAPGGHLGRLCIWTESAISSLDSVFGTFTDDSKFKKGFKLPRPMLQNSNIGRIFTSSAVHKFYRPTQRRHFDVRKINFTKNARALAIVNPYSAEVKRTATRAQRRIQNKRAARVNNAGKKPLSQRSKDAKTRRQKKLLVIRAINRKFQSVLRSE